MKNLLFVLSGIFSTFAIDVWAEFLGRYMKLPVTNWGMVGRWFQHMPQGRFIHSTIKNASPMPYEKAVGWGAHYLIGIIYSVFYFSVVVPIVGEVSFISGLSFGVVTIFFPWLVLQPGLGLGVFARKAESPNIIRLINLSIHSIFGMCLYFGWTIFKVLLGVPA